MNNNKVLEQFDALVKKISEFDKVALFHDRDADGLGAGVITAHAIFKLTGKKPEIIQAVDYPNLKDQLKSATGFSLIIIVDVAIDSKPEWIKELEKESHVLIIDHHKIVNDLTSKKTTFIKPQMFCEIEPSAYPTAKLCFDLFSRKVDVSEKDWVSSIGIFGDVSYNQWKEFIDNTAKKYSLTANDFNEVAKVIASVETIKPELFKDIFELFYNEQDVNKALDSGLDEFKKYKSELDVELDKFLNDFEENKEDYPEKQLSLYYFKPKHNVKSILATLLSFKHENETIVIMQDTDDGKISFSGRRQDMKVAVNDLLVDAIKGIENSSAGGHTPAAAGTIQKKDMQTFKQNLLNAATARIPQS